MTSSKKYFMTSSKNMTCLFDCDFIVQWTSFVMSLAHLLVRVA